MAQHKLPLRVFLVDDHALIRASLRKLLESEENIEVVGEASGLDGLAETIRELQPDVVLMDISLGDGQPDGFEGTRIVKQVSPETAVLMVTIHADEAMLEEAARAGASGYVLKASTPEELLAAISAAAEGAGYISPPMVGKIMNRIAGRQGPAVRRNADKIAEYGLTPREVDVLERIVQGMTYEEIAKELFVSKSQIKQLAGSLCRKLGARDKAHAAAIAVAAGLVAPPTVR